jgi:hypothetical protein
LGTPLIPILASIGNQHSDRVSRFNILATWIVGVAVTLPLICIPEIPQFVYGQQYSGTSFIDTFLFVMLSTCVIFYKQGLARVLSLRNLMWWGVLSNGVWGAVLLSSAFLLRKYGATGISLAYAIAYVTNTVIFIPLYLKLGFVPARTMVSLEAGAVWGALAAGVALSFLEVELYCRVIYLAIGSIACVVAFRRLATKPDSQEQGRRIEEAPSAAPVFGEGARVE